jgi:hypothetical protein
MSSIKGGGRAKISSDIEESIILLLLRLRDSKNPLLPRTTIPATGSDADNRELLHHHTSFDDLSDHDKRKERKLFLKQLLKCHQHQQLSQKLNMKQVQKSSSHGATSATVFKADDSESTGKVRIEIIEAIVKSDDKKKSKKSSKSESRKSVSKWREGGTRKALVLPRSTDVKELKKLCKAKLQMKAPKRLFIIDKDSKLEMDLISDLSGLDDGTLVYATSSDVFKDEDNSKEVANDMLDTKTEEPTELIDYLQPIKDVYRMHKMNYKRRISYNNEPLPKFGPSLSDLEPLSEARAALPSAAFRQDILRSLDDSRVLIICGATGCG